MMEITQSLAKCAYFLECALEAGKSTVSLAGDQVTY